MMMASPEECPVQTTVTLANSTTVTIAVEDLLSDFGSELGGGGGANTTNSSCVCVASSTTNNSGEGESGSARRMVEEQEANQPRQTTPFNVVSRVQLHQLDEEVLVMPCAPNIFTGANFEYFGQLATMVGAKQLESCILPYFGAGIGQTHLIDMQSTAGSQCCSIKALAFVLFPPNFVGDSLFDLYLCYRNALDRAAEANHTSIVFIHPAVATTINEWTVMRTAVCTIGHWLVTSAYKEKSLVPSAQINSITIVCDSNTAKEHYDKMVEQLLNDLGNPLALFPNLRALVEGRQPLPPSNCTSETANCEEPGRCPSNTSSAETAAPTSPNTSATASFIELVERVLAEETRRYVENTTIDAAAGEGNQLDGVGSGVVEEKRIDPEEAEDYRKLLSHPERIHANEEQLYDLLFRGPNGNIDIQLSTHLIRRVLLVQSASGLVYTFRFAYSYGEKDEHLNFACISCDSASRGTGLIMRARALVDGAGILWHDDAKHHPNCRPVRKAYVILVQLQRRLRLYKKQNGKLRKKVRKPKAKLMDQHGVVDGANAGWQEDEEMLSPSLSECATSTSNSYPPQLPAENGAANNAQPATAVEEGGQNEVIFSSIASYNGEGSNCSGSGLETLMCNEIMWTDVTEATMLVMAGH